MTNSRKPDKKDDEKRKPQSEESAPKVDKPASVSGMLTAGGHFPVVGIGASAGGLSALEAFLSAMPRGVDTGIAFVFVQHLAPDHASVLGELVKRNTSMRVMEVEDGMHVEPDTLYLIPPNHDMALINGTLQLFAPTSVRGLHLPIDFFFKSLAQDQRGRAICVVLSGTGTDGTLGARAVKGEGGMVIAQNPESTEYEGMPSSAIAAGIVDHVLPPAEMPAQIFSYVNHLFGGKLSPLLAPTPKVGDTLQKICLVVRSQTGHDFSRYKENTIARRVARRMALHQIDNMEDYLRYLHSSSGETEALFRDLLIGVTSFFRDPEAFATLKSKAIPRLLENREAGSIVRAWVCGCSTGEEAYSIAILFQEHLEEHHLHHRIQIFATDIDAAAISQARSGIYPVSIAADVTSQRLARYFVLEAGGAHYRVKKSIRDMLIFSEQNLIRDPPFSKVDLISCRNLLIYMNAELQKTLIPLFHYALNPDGVLMLGTSESAGEHSTLFSTLDRKWKIYLRRQDIAPGPRFILPTIMTGAVAPPGGEVVTRTRGQQPKSADLRGLTEQALLTHYGQAAVLINAHGEIRYIHGRTGKYLEPAPGDATVNILSMAREGLRRELSTALHRAVTRKEVVTQAPLRIKTNGDTISARLVVRPLSLPNESADPEYYLIVLEELPPAPSVPQDAAEQGTNHGDTSTDSRIAALEHELTAKEEYLQSTLEEMETTNEELRSTNEELQSVNEELQSTNEELETSKEELQSVNEELSTVNAELQAKVAELSRANNDMNNLLAGTGIGTLFVDHQLRITRFTPAITQVINLIQSDIGRPIGHFVSNLVGYSRLVEDVKAVLDTLMPREAVVQVDAGTWYLMRIRPYRTLDNVIEGAVITFVDISERRRVETIAKSQLAEIVSYYDNAPIGLAVLDNDLRFIRINKRLAEINGLTPTECIGKSIDTLSSSLVTQASATAEQVRATGEPVVDLHRAAETGFKRDWQTGWYPLKDDTGTVVGFSIIMFEATDQNDGVESA